MEWDSPKTGFTRKAAYIRTWFDRKLPKLPGSWSDYELHHIQPREYGGTNDFENLVPLSRAQHRLFTNWWAGYRK